MMIADVQYYIACPQANHCVTGLHLAEALLEVQCIEVVHMGFPAV